MDIIVKKYGGRANQSVREFLAETMGTFILVMCGVGGVAHLVLGKGKAGEYLSINFGWGYGVMFGVYWSAGVSGGHINPAVSLAMVVAGRLPLKKLPLYWAGQTLGAFLASALCFGVYKDLVYAFEKANSPTTPGVHLTLKTAGIWSVYPNPATSHGTIFGDQVVGTALLVGTIFALIDKRNNGPNKELLPMAIGFLVLVIGASFGMNCGYGINPARDLIPRIFTAIAGWKSQPFTAYGYFFWISIIGQLVGGVLGAIVYIVTIELHHPKEQSVENQLVNEAGTEEDKL